MTSGKRIALVLPDFGGGGAERVALLLAGAWVERGHEVDLVLQRAEGELLQLLPPQVMVFDLGAKRIRNVVLPLASYLKKREPHAVQVSMWPLTVAAVVAHRLARSSARLVVSEHIALSKQYGGKGQLRDIVLRKSIAWFYPMADVRIAVSQSAAEDLAGLAGLPRSSIAVVYNPVPEPQVDEIVRVQVDALWGDAGARILSVGRFNRQKNHAVLIRAFALLRRKRLAKLMIVGEGPLRAELEGLARKEGVEKDVILPGFTLDPGPYYSTADLFAFSSDYEGFGLVLVEALRFGLPVVSTDCESGPREILNGGEFGALVPCGDPEALETAMVVALDSPLSRDKLSARGRELSGIEAPDRYLELMLQTNG